MSQDEGLQLLAVLASVAVVLAYVVLLVRAKDKTPWIVLGLVMILVALCSWMAKALTGVN